MKDREKVVVKRWCGGDGGDVGGGKQNIFVQACDEMTFGL